jgi:hypothetical protein
LINGASVQRDIQCRAVTYYHVELDAHDILLAENLPAESYLDTGNRKHFENAGMSIVLHPDFGDGQARRVVESCRPFADDVTGVEWTWQRIATRATLLGFHVPVDFETTADPELHIAIDGRVIRPIGAQAGRLVFALPPEGGQVRLVSRAAAPCDGQPWVEDRRRLGVMVSRLTSRCGDAVEPIPLDHPMLVDGWWAVEGAARRLWRWTDGDAALPWHTPTTRSSRSNWAAQWRIRYNPQGTMSRNAWSPRDVPNALPEYRAGPPGFQTR